MIGHSDTFAFGFFTDAWQVEFLRSVPAQFAL